MTKNFSCDVLIIGGGAAGLFAAIRLSELNPATKIIVVDKADVRRSGCLAAGVNALNAYVGKGHTPEDYVEYAFNDAHGIADKNLLLTMAKRLNSVTKKIERLGLVIVRRTRLAQRQNQRRKSQADSCQCRDKLSERHDF